MNPFNVIVKWLISTNQKTSLVLTVLCDTSRKLWVSSETGKMLLLWVLLPLFYSLASTEEIRDESGVIAETINEFGFDLLNIFNQDSRLKDENLFYSPTSISLSLAMVFLGSRGNTAEQIAKAFRRYSHEFEDVHLAMKSLHEAVLESERENLELKIANRIWGHDDLEETDEFKESSLAFYNAPVKKVDFKESSEQARIEINNWVEQNTARKIKDFLPPKAVNRDTRLALINAIYFKGTWLHAFRREKTFRAPFKTSGEMFLVEMMSRTTKHNYFADEKHDCKIIELPYSGNDISMLVALPNEINGVSRLEKMITTEIMSLWLMSVQNTTVKVSIPKFILSQHFELKDVLSKLGISDLFQPGISDLSGLSSVESLYVSHVMHKAHIDVNEQGTEAAAASGVLVQKRSIDLHPEFYADHPFLFFIYHKSSSAVLFIGRVNRPKITEEIPDTINATINTDSVHQSDEL